MGVSVNDPKLFDLCEGSNKKILWLINSGLLLSKPEYFQATINHNPTIVYQGKTTLTLSRWFEIFRCKND